MEHLSLEMLGRLVSSAPTDEERQHLDRCPGCASELDALRHQTAALGQLPDLRPPGDDWAGLEAALSGEGLVEPAGDGSVSLGRARSEWPGAMRRAGAVVLFLGGAGVGAVAGGAMARSTASPAVPGDPTVATSPLTATDPAIALAQMQEAERVYIDALVHYRQLAAAQGADETAGDPERRYAALEQLVRAGQVAVRQAPADPFFNGLLASALAEQQAVYLRLSADGIEAGSQDGWF